MLSSCPNTGVKTWPCTMQTVGSVLTSRPPITQRMVRPRLGLTISGLLACVPGDFVWRARKWAQTSGEVMKVRADFKRRGHKKEKPLLLLFSLIPPRSPRGFSARHYLCTTKQPATRLWVHVSLIFEWVTGSRRLPVNPKSDRNLISPVSITTKTKV